MSEAKLQEAVATYFQVVLPREVLAFHIPNEGRRGWHAQRAFKRGGGMAGLPDWCLIWQGRCFWIELKAGAGKLSEKQAEAHARLWEAGCPVVVCRSIDEVRTALLGWAIPIRDARAAA
jgi:hypothetical protein